MNFIGNAKYLMYGGISTSAQGNKVMPIADIYTLKLARSEWVWEKQES